jgi:6,7-dimethyl-8-ribityllumazine synthase
VLPTFEETMNQTLANPFPQPCRAAHRGQCRLAPRHRAAAVQSLRAELAPIAARARAHRRYEVPGAFEIPLHAQRLARSGRHDAMMACALVVNGGIYRHDFVAHAVIDGLMRVQLDTDVPVFSPCSRRRPFTSMTTTALLPRAFREEGRRGGAGLRADAGRAAGPAAQPVVFYLAATRATQRLMIGVMGEGNFANQLKT